MPAAALHRCCRRRQPSAVSARAARSAAQCQAHHRGLQEQILRGRTLVAAELQAGCQACRTVLLRQLGPQARMALRGMGEQMELARMLLDRTRMTRSLAALSALHEESRETQVLVRLNAVGGFETR